MLAALSRQMQLRVLCPASPTEHGAIEALRAMGIDIVACEVSERSIFSETVRLLGSLRRREPYVMYRRHAWPVVRRALESQLRTFQPDVLYLDHLDSLIYRSVAPHIRSVVDLHNVYSLLVRRAAEEERRSWRSAFLLREARLLDAVERQCARGDDVLLTVSEQEAEHFRSLGANAVHVIPNGVDCHALADLPTGRNNAPTVLFLGTMSWGPNASAARFLVELLPRLRLKVPDVTVLIVGRDPPADLASLNGSPGVEVTGSVQDVKPYLLRGTVMAVPLDAGGGTRLKILEAFAAGLPVVSTRVGAEGIEAIPGQHLLSAERAEFVDALADLLLFRERNHQIASEARRLARDKYDWGVIGPRAARLVAAVSESRVSRSD
jgi:polysaccharide biosynthesis protein PslH